MKKISVLICLFLLNLPSFALDELDYNLPVNLYNGGDLKGAIKAVKKLEHNGVKDAKYSLLKYEIYKKQNKIQQAKEALDEALKYDKDCYEAYIALAIIALEDSNTKLCKKYFEQAFKIAPELTESPEILYYYARICILEHDYDSALEYILGAIELDSSVGSYYLELGKVYLQKGDYLKAVNALDYAIGEDESLNFECYNYIGLANYRRGNFKQAVKYFEMAVSGVPNNLIYLNNLALCHKSLGNVSEYEKIVSKLSFISPSSPEEYLQFSQLLYDRKNYDKARSVLEKGIETYPNNLLLKSALNKLNKL